MSSAENNRCAAPYCRNLPDITVIGVRLCDKCWSRYCEDAEFKEKMRVLNPVLRQPEGVKTVPDLLPVGVGTNGANSAIDASISGKSSVVVRR